MGVNTKIEWCDHTFNPWVGCAKISPACDGCYAEAWAKRAGRPNLWKGDRERTTPAYWNQPHRWNRVAQHASTRPRVFSGSLCDIFDNAVPPGWRSDLFQLIEKTPDLDWLLLTKRIGNVMNMTAGVSSWPNVWLGATVVNQEEADRDIPKLLATPARIRFLSIEPMLQEIDLSTWIGDRRQDATQRRIAGLNYERQFIHWVIVGGESGPGARPLHPKWVRSIRDQCAAARIPFLFKQWGHYLPEDQPEAQNFGFETQDGRDAFITFPDGLAAVRLHKKSDAGRMLDGKDHTEFPR